MCYVDTRVFQRSVKNLETLLSLACLRCLLTGARIISLARTLSRCNTFVN